MKLNDIAENWSTLTNERTVPPVQTTTRTAVPITDEQPTAATAVEEKTEPTVRVVEEQSVRPTVKYIGELFSTYLLCEMAGELYVIDKHAAHERLLYNQLIASPHAESQQLLAPISVALSREEYAALMLQTDVLTEVGFEVEEFGGSEVLIRAVPMILSGCDISRVIREIAGGFAQGHHKIRSSALDWIYHSTACRAAVKAGDESRPAELARFAERVLYNDDIRTCPHGRPVCFSLTKQEIEKQFGRIV